MHTLKSILLLNVDLINVCNPVNMVLIEKLHANKHIMYICMYVYETTNNMSDPKLGNKHLSNKTKQYANGKV